VRAGHVRSTLGAVNSEVLREKIAVQTGQWLSRTAAGPGLRCRVVIEKPDVGMQAPLFEDLPAGDWL
jgi:hypothetical protein